MANLTKNEKYIVDMYVRYFGEVPSVAEIAKYNAFGKQKLILEKISGDAKASKAGLTTEEIVNSAYQNLFGRDANEKEMNKYSKVVDKGKDLPINAIVKSAKKDDKGVFEAKKAIAIMLAEQKITTNYDLDKITKDTYAVVYDLKTKKLLVDSVKQLEDKIDAIPDNGSTPNVPSETFTLTTSATGDSLVGTEKSDLFNATTLNTLQSNDVLLDTTTTDSDILNATVTGSTVKAKIQNIETINVTGEYVTTGLDLTSVSGTKTLNLDTKIAGGTAKVIEANSINAAAIKAGANISTLDITSLSSGTRDTVTVDGGNANVNLTGKVGGADKYSVTIAKDKILNAVSMDSSGDELTVNASNNFTLNATTAAIATATINNTGSAAITVTTANTTNIATKLNLSGNAVTLKGDADAFTGTSVTAAGVEVTSTATKSTIELSGGTAAGTVYLNKAQVSEVLISGTGLTGLTVNENSKLVLAADQKTHATQGVTANINNAKGDLGTGTGTLLLDVNATQTKIVETGANVDTVILNAGTKAANGNATVTMADLDLNAKTNTLVIQGANDLTLTKLTLNSTTADVVSATTMTGKLTVAETVGTGDATLTLGSNDDSITSTQAAKFTIHANGGNDKISIAFALAGSIVNGGDGDDTITGNALGAELNGGAGNDTITGGAGIDTINGGDGDDIIDGKAGNDIITLGAGKDTVIIHDTAANIDVISDFVVGTDKLVLTGTSTGTALNLKAITPATNTYTLGTTHVVTLTGVTATDLSNSVQLGKQAVGTTAAVTYQAAANATITSGALNDHITQGAGTLTLDAGAGDDIIISGTNNAATLTGGAGSDTFIVTNTAASTISDFGATDILQMGAAANSLTVTVIEDFVATAVSTNASTTTANTTLNLKDGVDIDMTLATMTSGTVGYTIKTDAAVTTGATIVGSRAADVITGSKFADKITGGEGADTITAGAGADTIILTESVSVADIVRIDTIAESVTSANFKTIHNFVSTVDKINFKQGAGSLTGVTTDGSSAVSAMSAAVANTTTVNSIADVYAALATYTTLAASNADGSATIAQAYTFANGSAAGTYVVVNDATAGFQAATDVVIQLTGTTTIAASDFTFDV